MGLKLKCGSLWFRSAEMNYEVMLGRREIQCDWSLQHWNGADSETKHNHDGQGVVSMLVACLKTHLTFQSRDILCSHANRAAANPSLHATKVTSDLRL